MHQIFVDYLNSVGIVKVEAFDDDHRSLIGLNEEAVRKHLEVMADFQKRASGYKGYLNLRFDNNTGRYVEECKVCLRRMKRCMAEAEKDENEFYELLRVYGEENIRRAENCLEQVHSAKYIELLRRSMANDEVCLGKPWFDNIRNKGGIQVINLDKLCYNMAEMDAVCFLTKLKKKAAGQFDTRSLAQHFCEARGLDENSEKFILAMTSFPVEFAKVCMKYREKGDLIACQEYARKLKKAMASDGESCV